MALLCGSVFGALNYCLVIQQVSILKNESFSKYHYRNDPMRDLNGHLVPMGSDTVH